MSRIVTAGWVKQVVANDVGTADALVRSAIADLIDEQAGLSGLPLRQWRAKRATIATDGIDIVTIGDSNTEGGSAPDPDDSWTNVSRDGLRRLFQPDGITGGFGYMPARYAHSGITNHFTVASGSVVSAVTHGLGRRRLTVNPNSSVQVTFTGTSFTLFFLKTSSGGNFTVTIDGGSPQTLSSQNAATLFSQTWDSGPLSAGEHTVVIACTATNLGLEGMMTYNGDEDAGIRTWQGGHSGYKVADFTSASTATGQWQAVLDVIQPDLVAMLWGTNDYKLLTPLATFKSDLDLLIADIRAHTTVNPSILFVMAPQRQDAFTPIAPYSDYLEAMREVARDDGDVAIIDLAALMGTSNDTNGTGLVNADKIHLTAAGEGFVGEQVVELLRT